MPSLYDNAFAPQADESLPPELKGALSQGTGPQEMRGLPIQSPVPSSPLDLFVRKPFTAPEVSGGGYSAPPPIEHARMQPIQVDDSLSKMANQSLDQVTSLLGKIGEKKQPSVEDLMARIRAASATTTQEEKQNPSKVALPDVSSDRADYYKTTGGIESGNRDGAVNPYYSPDKAAAGVFQFMPSTVASMRLQNPELAKQLDANWRTDRRQQLLLMNAYTDISDNMIRAITEKEPTNDQRYAMHLFGHGRGAQLIKNPSAPIESFFPSKAAFDEAVRVNPGVIRPGMTGEEFFAWARPLFGRKQ